MSMRDMNKALAGITGAKVNREAGYGSEVPSVYHLLIWTHYIDKMEFVESLLADGHYNLCSDFNWRF